MTIGLAIIAAGLALASYKYTASVLGYIVIRHNKMFGYGDRIRIGGLEGKVRNVGMFHIVVEELKESGNQAGKPTGRVFRIPTDVVASKPILKYPKRD